MPALFYAEWCPFCTSFYPQFEKAMDGKSISWADVDISDMDDPLWETFDINVVPTIIVFKEGQAVFRKDGILGRGLSQKALDETIVEMETLRAR